MEAGRWRRMQELFDAAVELPADDQAAFLADACAGDAELRCEVEALLRSDAAAGTFIEQAIRRGSDLLLADQASPSLPARIGKYEISGRLGEGGFGVVYRGLDPVLHRAVAVKSCSSRDERLRRRFVREGQIAAGLQHPNITTVFDLGVEAGVPYLVHELLEGEDLNLKIARREPFTALQRLDVLAQVARGLEHAHRQGVLHRDVKPANLRVLPDGAVKIMDFGIAKLLHDTSDVTSQGSTLGTVGYLAPEQLRGGEIDRRTDIFAFGVTAYELLTGERPFEGRTFSEVSYRLLNEEPRALQDLAAAHGAVLAAVVRRCLAKEPEQRYDSFAEVLAVLEPEIDALRSGVFAVSPAARPAAPRRARRVAAFATASAAAAALVVVALAVPGRREPEARPAAGPGGRAASTRGAPPAAAALPATPTSSRAAATRPQMPPAPALPKRSAEAASRQDGERAAGGGVASNRVVGAAPAVAAAAAAATASDGGAVAAAPESRPGGSAGGERDAAAAQQETMLPFERAAAAARESPPAGGGGASAAPSPPTPAGGAPAGVTAAAAADAEEAPRPMSRGDLIRPRGPGVVPPRLLSRPEPDYPDRARRRRAEAHVLLLVLVDENGRVLRAIVKRTDDPDLGFNQAARRAALQALFAPATRDGIAGKMWTELPFDFLVKS